MENFGESLFSLKRQAQPVTDLLCLLKDGLQLFLQIVFLLHKSGRNSLCLFSNCLSIILSYTFRLPRRFGR